MKRHVITVSLGDWNLGEADVNSIARACGGTYYQSTGVDGAIVSGAHKVTVTTLPKFGSDHHHMFAVEIFYASHTLRLLCWNPWVGQQPSEVLETLKVATAKWKPDVVVLQEAYRLRQVLRQVPGYRRHQGRNVGEGADCALLLQRRHTVKNDGVLVMREPWEAKKPKAPRQYPFDRLQIRDAPLVLRVLDVHFPTKGMTGENAAAVGESRDRVVRWHRTKTKGK